MMQDLVDSSRVFILSSGLSQNLIKTGHPKSYTGGLPGATRSFGGHSSQGKVLLNDYLEYCLQGNLG